MKTIEDKLLQNEIATEQRERQRENSRINAALSECDTKLSHAQGKITKRILEEDNYPIVITEVFGDWFVKKIFAEQFKSKVDKWAKENDVLIALAPITYTAIEFRVTTKHKSKWRFW